MRNRAKCPVCGQRLFDYENEDKCKIEIKCSRCKCIAAIDLATKTQKIGAY